MSKSWAGPLITVLIALGVGVVLYTNLQSPGASTSASRQALKPAPDPQADAKPKPKPKANGVREIPVGDPVVKNHIQVAAVYLPAVAMDGSAPGGADLIHLEADVRAVDDNPNGFAKDEFIPYLKLTYEVVPAAGGPAIEKGELTPMVAWDGLHYGANVVMPKVGEYRLHYDLQPPSAGGLGRHSDPATGVAPWWGPFRATFEWTVEPKAPAVAAGR